MNLSLFSPEARINLLPYDGVVEDLGLILTEQQSTQYLNYFLKHLSWQQDEVFLFGRHYQTARQVAWYGDEHYQYYYSGKLKQAQVWQPALWRLKQHIETLVDCKFNSCLANLYHNGTQAVGWHSDDEPALISNTGQETVIASLSLGATRKFSLKHKHTAEKIDLLLQTGQLIVMRGKTQIYWKHALMKSTRISAPRINLTFRYFFNKQRNN